MTIHFHVSRRYGGLWANGSYGTQAIGTWAENRPALARDLQKAVQEMQRLRIFPKGLRVQLGATHL